MADGPTDRHHDWVAGTLEVDPRTGQPVQPADAQTTPDQAAGASLVNDPAFERLIEAMEEDGEEADATWKSQVNDGIFTYINADIHAQYNADGVECDKARGNFNLEWNKIVGGKGDPKALMAAYDLYALKIGALQMANARVDALIAIGFLNKIAPFLAWVLKVKQFELALQFQKRLKKLAADLEQAESAVKDAKVKMALNIVVSAVTTIAAPEEVLAKVLVSGGSMAVHIVIDQSLGNGQVAGTVVFVTGDSGDFIELSKHGKEAIEKLKGGSKTIGVAAAAITAVLDYDEVKESKEIVEKLKKELEETSKAFDELMAGVLPLEADFIMLDKLIHDLPDMVQKAIDAGNDAAINYDAIKQEIARAIQEGS